MKKLKVSLWGQDFYADLLPDKAPRIIEALEQAGEFTSFIVYAKICDHEITWPVPFLVDELENPVWDQVPGSVIFYPPHQAVCIFYGDTPSVAWCNQFALMPPDELARLRPVADRVWAEQGAHVTTSIVDVDDEGGEQE